MSVRQVQAAYQALERGDAGYPKISPPSARVPTMRELFGRRCFLLGVHDKAKVAELWRDEKKRIEEFQAKASRPPGRRRKT